MFIGMNNSEPPTSKEGKQTKSRQNKKTVKVLPAEKNN